MEKGTEIISAIYDEIRARKMQSARFVDVAPLWIEVGYNEFYLIAKEPGVTPFQYNNRDNRASLFGYELRRVPKEGWRIVWPGQDE